MQSTLFTISHPTSHASEKYQGHRNHLPFGTGSFLIVTTQTTIWGDIPGVHFMSSWAQECQTLARISFWSFVEACWSGIQGNPPFVHCPPGCMGYWQWRYPDAKEDVHTNFARIVRRFVDHQSTCGAGSIPMFPDTISLYLNDLWKSTRGGFLPWERWITQVSYNPLYFQFKWVLFSSE